MFYVGLQPRPLASKSRSPLPPTRFDFGISKNSHTHAPQEGFLKISRGEENQKPENGNFQGDGRVEFKPVGL